MRPQAYIRCWRGRVLERLGRYCVDRGRGREGRHEVRTVVVSILAECSDVQTYSSTPHEPHSTNMTLTLLLFLHRSTREQHTESHNGLGKVNRFSVWEKIYLKISGCDAKNALNVTEMKEGTERTLGKRIMRNIWYLSFCQNFLNLPGKCASVTSYFLSHICYFTFLLWKYARVGSQCIMS